MPENQIDDPPILEVNARLLEQFGELFHVSLRKGVDSRYSVISWNSISLAPNGIYGAFCDYMVDRLKGRPKIGLPDFKRLLQGWSSNDFVQCEGYCSEVRQIISIFDASINAMPDDDIQNMIRFINFCLAGR